MCTTEGLQSPNPQGGQNHGVRKREQHTLEQYWRVLSFLSTDNACIPRKAMRETPGKSMGGSVGFLLCVAPQRVASAEKSHINILRQSKIEHKI